MTKVLNSSKNIVQEKENWKHIEFFAPINETFINNSNEFFIKGVAINETTTRNGITYISEELEKAAPSFRNKPILKDHENSVSAIVGRTTENVNFVRGEDSKGRIDFEGKIMDQQIREMINDGRIQNVSIGTMLEDLQENEEDGTITAIGMHGLEISLVAVPGDPGAGLTQALHESLDIKKKLKTKLQTEDKQMEDTEVEKPQEAETPETPETTAAPEEEVAETPTEDTNDAEEKLKIMKAELAKYKAKEAAEAFKTKVAEEVKRQMEDAEPPVEDTPAEAEPEDETKGEVGAAEEDPATEEEGLIVERAETGKGFAIYRDYSAADDGKFRRLCR